MANPLDDVCLARLPAEVLSLLGAVRTAPGVRVWRNGASVWLRWEPGDDALLRCVQPIAGAELFALRGDRWHRLGHALPAFEVADIGAGEPLAQWVVPEPVEPAYHAGVQPAPVPLCLAAHDSPRPTTALRCTLEQLVLWTDNATSRQLARVQAVMCAGEAILLGDKLPMLPEAIRYWGQSVFVPLGFRPEPNLPESALREALELSADEMALLDAEAVEVIERSSFAQLTRAAARLALRS